MSAKDVVSTVLLLFSIVVGPAIFLITIVWYSVSSLLSSIKEHQEQCYLRSLPCGNCQYFTNDEFLQCAVNPCQVMTEEARICHDYLERSVCAAANEYRSSLRRLLSRQVKLRTLKSISENTQ